MTTGRQRGADADAERAPSVGGRTLGRRAFEAAAPIFEASLAVVIGVFSPAGEARFANRGMDRLLAGPGDPFGVRSRLLYPPFARLAAAERINPIFEGILQFGDRRTVGHSVQGQVRGGGGHLSARSRAEPGRVVIEIEDDGIGMTPDVLGRAFEPFFTTKPVGQGTGLGLTIAHKIIVDRHGGTITATSTPGAGTTFTIALPLEVRR